MKRPIAKSLLVGIMSFGVAAVVAHAGQVRQFSAQFLNFDGTEQSTTLEPSSGGQPIYRGSVFVSADVDTLEITISATGDMTEWWGYLDVTVAIAGTLSPGKPTSAHGAAAREE